MAGAARRGIVTPEALERRRRRTWAWTKALLVMAVAGIPLGLLISPNGEADELAGAMVWLSIAAVVALLFVLGTWRRYMARKLLDALVAERPGLCHLDGEVEQGQAAGTLRSAACELGRFGGVGLVEPFRAAHIATSFPDPVSRS